MLCIEARDLRKTYGATQALAGLELSLEPGRILGLIGPNGAGKSTAMAAILGLTRYEGELRVLGRDPWRERGALMQDVCFIADVAVLPRWLRVAQALDYVAGVHPRFNREKAAGFLARTDIKASARVRDLSKGMVTQLHLALILAIDARLLVLDEPTLGLDLLYRKQFYDTLLNDYFREDRSILVTTHQVEEIEHILTDLAFINRGKIILQSTIDELETRFTELQVAPAALAEAQALGPVAARQGFGRTLLTYDGVPRERLAPLGEMRTPRIADLFIALMAPQGVAA